MYELVVDVAKGDGQSWPAGGSKFIICLFVHTPPVLT